MSNFTISKLRKALSEGKITRNRSKVKRNQNKKVINVGNKKMSKKQDLNTLFRASITEAVEFFKKDPQAFFVYHDGFKQQLDVWPNDPLKWVKSSILKYTENTNENIIIADLGCGDARLSTMFLKSFFVHSFDLVAVNNRVTTCDIAKTPLKENEVDFAVFCLSLMSTNCQDFIYEANRILKTNAYLIIVDVASRFDGKFNQFLKTLKCYGFAKYYSEITKDTYFVRACLRKVSNCYDKPIGKFPKLILNPCTYKKR